MFRTCNCMKLGKNVSQPFTVTKMLSECFMYDLVLNWPQVDIAKVRLSKNHYFTEPTTLRDLHTETQSVDQGEFDQIWRNFTNLAKFKSL